MDSLNTYYTNMNQNAQTMSNLRNEVSGAGYSTNSNFQQQTVSTLTAYSSNLKSFQGLLAFLAADKGLANYDKSNQLETTLKNAVNTTKNVLSSISDMINADPTLGPLIGPLVYAIKCIIDEILDAVENLTDGILNDLQPLLQALLGQATDVTCSTGINILGLCLVLR
ncbi:hypothetical protein OBBRIDRAFT_368030 [Obba rivulosa]|uniref:Uncharacterized protein n=1 Tax=Obba rivulosa TaxID=1052685 RepID=A0A8E2DUE3_9APHY|nr:hypothetical protein OBBRIDRAFT_368030 [Obba rivulosa]